MDDCFCLRCGARSAFRLKGKDNFLLPFPDCSFLDISLTVLINLAELRAVLASAPSELACVVPASGYEICTIVRWRKDANSRLTIY